MMDGCMVYGAIKELLLRTHRRLFDYINDVSEALIKLHLKAGGTGLINKAYIVRVSLDQDDTA
jgi:hypothetical protein